MKRALILCEVFHPEEFLINDLVQRWESDGYELEVLTKVPSYPFGKVYPGFRNRIYQKTTSYGITVHRVAIIEGYDRSVFRKTLNYFTFSVLTTIVLLFIGKRFDRIFVYQTGPLTLATGGLVSKKLYKNKLTIWTQDLWPDTVFAYGFRETRCRRAILRWFVRAIYRNCDLILVTCEGFIEKIREFVPDKEIIFVPNWPPVDNVPVESIKLPGDFNFTFAGNIGKVQNLENVITGFSLFARNNPSVYLNIVGDGSNLAHLKAIVEEQKIPNVHFTGRRPLSEMSAYFAASDVLILSLKDMPLFELTVPAKFQAYLTASKPIFSLIRGEVSRIVNKYSIGISSDPMDVAAMAKCYDKFYRSSREDLDNFSRNAAHLLKMYYSKEVLIKKISNSFWSN
jgi:glycosyltransferase involved in cell wall biosynthesis